jgi:hypothetical protein
MARHTAGTCGSHQSARARRSLSEAKENRLPRPHFGANKCFCGWGVESFYILVATRDGWLNCLRLGSSSHGRHVFPSRARVSVNRAP